MLEGVDQGHLQELVTWLYQKSENGRPRVPESRYLQQLSFVVARSEALGRFRQGAALRDAAMLTEMPVQAFETSLRKARDLLRLALDNMRKIRRGQLSDQRTHAGRRREDAQAARSKVQHILGIHRHESAMAPSQDRPHHKYTQERRDDGLDLEMAKALA